MGMHKRQEHFRQVLSEFSMFGIRIEKALIGPVCERIPPNWVGSVLRRFPFITRKNMRMKEGISIAKNFIIDTPRLADLHNGLSDEGHILKIDATLSKGKIG